jgi:hypothetical protein
MLAMARAGVGKLWPCEGVRNLWLSERIAIAGELAAKGSRHPQSLSVPLYPAGERSATILALRRFGRQAILQPATADLMSSIVQPFIL